MGSLRSFFIAISLVSLFSYSHGLQCYNCVYSPGLEAFLPPEMFGESCKDGNVPEEKFAVSCDAEYPDIEAVCAKVFLNGKYQGISLEVTMRACAPKDVGIPDGCQKVTVEDISELPGLDPALVELIRDFSPDTAIKLCSCNVDKCSEEGGDDGGDGGDNGGGGGGGGGNSGTTLKITSLTWLLSSFILAVSKFM